MDFTHERGYANGFLRNTPGWAWVKVSQLEPEENYKFAISQFCSNVCTEKTLIWLPGGHKAIPENGGNTDRTERNTQKIKMSFLAH